MPKFAKIGVGNVVEKVVVADSAEWCEENIAAGTWIETDKDGEATVNYAGPGMIWDSGNNGFLPASKPFPSWVLNTETMRYEAPEPHPGGGTYAWDEDEQEWVVYPLQV